MLWVPSMKDLHLVGHKKVPFSVEHHSAGDRNGFHLVAFLKYLGVLSLGLGTANGDGAH